MKLDRDAILKAKDRKIISEEVPEWGGTVGIIVMSGEARDIYSDANKDKVELETGKVLDVKGLQTSLLVATLCDEDTGELLFSEEEDVIALGKKNADVLGRLFLKSLEHNGMTEKAQKDIAKN